MDNLKILYDTLYIYLIISKIIHTEDCYFELNVIRIVVFLQIYTHIYNTWLFIYIYTHIYLYVTLGYIYTHIYIYIYNTWLYISTGPYKHVWY